MLLEILIGEVGPLEKLLPKITSGAEFAYPIFSPSKLGFFISIGFTSLPLSFCGLKDTFTTG
jgi:hypothetical protein